MKPDQPGAKVTVKIAMVGLSLFQSIALAKDIKISEIVATYSANQARFHAQHRGTYLSGAATVTSIKADALGIGKSFRVQLDMNKSELICSTDDRTAAAALDKGQIVMFKGTVHDVLFDTLMLKDCVFSNIPPPPKSSHDLPLRKQPLSDDTDRSSPINAKPPLEKNTDDYKNICRRPDGLILACKTNRQIIGLYDLRESCAGSGNYAYRTWNTPKVMTDKPDVNITSWDSVTTMGTGPCIHYVANFKTGNINYEFTEVGCSDGSEPAGTVGEILVRINGEEKLRKWCVGLERK